MLVRDILNIVYIFLNIESFRLISIYGLIYKYIKYQAQPFGYLMR